MVLSMPVDCNSFKLLKNFDKRCLVGSKYNKRLDDHRTSSLKPF